MPTFNVKGASIAYVAVGAEPGQAPVQLFWAHGWGQDHRAFLPVAQALGGLGSHILFDFPGFGASPRPPEDWGTADYADAAAEILAALPPGRRIWIGHSFGCRVGVQLAARHPGLVDGLFLVAAAGLPRPRTLAQQARIKARVWIFKLLKALPKFGVDTSKMQGKFGSADYKSAGAMRPIFVKVVRENLSDQARQVTIPVQLVYGALDDDTPPALGEMYKALMPNAELTIVPRFDHHTILTDGAHQVQHRLGQFVARVCA